MAARTRFELELEREFEREIEGGFAELLADVADRVFDVASARTRVGATGRLKRAWGVSIGSRPDFRQRGKGAVGRIRLLALRNPLGLARGVFVHNGDFRASWHEHGTVKMAPRPMLRPAIHYARTVRR